MSTGERVSCQDSFLPVESFLGGEGGESLIPGPNWMQVGKAMPGPLGESKLAHFGCLSSPEQTEYTRLGTPGTGVGCVGCASLLQQ